MDPQIGLAVALDVQFSDSNGAINRLLENCGRDKVLSAGIDDLRQAD